MRDNNLFGDDSPTNEIPCITEISLKDLCTQIDFDALKSQTHEVESSCVIDDDFSTEGGCNETFSGWYLPETETSCEKNPSNNKVDISLENLNSKLEDENVLSDYAQNCIDNENELNENTEFMQKLPSNSLTRGHLPNGHVMCHENISSHIPDVIVRPDSPGIYDNTIEEQKPFLSSFHKTPSLPSHRMKSRTRKRHSWQETSFNDDMPDITYDEITKDDLLAMWKASEEELNVRLDKALREKSLLEKKLALLDVNQHTSV